MKSKLHSLTFKMASMFAAFSLVMLITSVIMSYISQMEVYKRQCMEHSREIGVYLSELMKADGKNTIMYHNYYMDHYREMEIPYDFTDYSGAQRAFVTLFSKEYPGKTFGVDVSFSELTEELKKAYFTYKHEYWLLTFEKAREAFDIPYTYFLVMGDPRARTETLQPDQDPAYNVFYMIDGERSVKNPADGSVIRDYNGAPGACLYLGDTFWNEPSAHRVEWKTWETGTMQNDYMAWDNEYGKTYAYYTPVIVNGMKLGLIGTEVEVEKVNRQILKNALDQSFGVGTGVVLCVVFMVILVNKFSISRIKKLEAGVSEYARTKDVSVAKKLDTGYMPSDELTSLTERFEELIVELDDYMKNLVKTKGELTDTKKRAEELKELADRDGLTGLRNKAAFDREAKRIDALAERGEIKRYGIVMIDLNFLKTINDGCGHDKGNEAIKKLCTLACDIFDHSPVFRVGGDEFVVILEKADLEHSDELIAAFNARLDEFSADESARPWERISAAVGTAFFAAGSGESVAAVLRRADKAMYERKKAMKAERT